MPSDGECLPYRIELRGDAKRKIEELSAATDIPQRLMVSRVVEWFAEQPEPIRAAVLGCYPREIASEIARLLLARMR